jgi:hypothetical protein
MTTIGPSPVRGNLIEVSRRPAPPKPPFSLTIGIVGHRPDRLPSDKDLYDKVEQQVADVLSQIRHQARAVCDEFSDYFAVESQASLELSLVTALAEGGDTIAAKAAIEQGYVIDAVLPFAQDNYQWDFKNEVALRQFCGLCSGARSRLVLPGKRTHSLIEKDPEADRAYEAAGLTVIGNCDILLTVWDEGASRGQGGTTDMVVAAASQGIPIIHVDAGGTKPTLVRWSGLDEFPLRAEKLDAVSSELLDTALPRLMKALVQPPDRKRERSGLLRHYRARFWPINPGFAYPALLTSLFVRLAWPKDMLSVRVDDLSDDLANLMKPGIARGGLPSDLLQAYSWADAVGLFFAQFFRSAFVLNFFVASFAVAAALLSLIYAKSDNPVLIEILLILIVAGNTIFGRHYGWHNRWFEAREVAERLRVAAMLWVLGIRPQAFAGGEPAWTGWYARAFVRVQPLRSGSFEGAEIDAARTAILNILQHQCGYHERNAQRMKRLDARLDWIGFVLFLATVLVAVDHWSFGSAGLGYLVQQFFGHADPREVEHLGIALSAFLPALATATYGIRVIGDFEGSARRSERAHQSLHQQIQAIGTTVSLDVLRRRARAAGETMLGDVASWRLAVESRELAIPG